jgi:hypothetical protein
MWKLCANFVCEKSSFLFYTTLKTGEYFAFVFIAPDTMAVREVTPIRQLGQNSTPDFSQKLYVESTLISVSHKVLGLT